MAALSEARRRIVLSALTDEQYRDVVNVLAGMPHLTITCQCVVLDDEDPSSIWPLSMVTVSVKIIRRPLLVLQTTNRQQQQQFGGAGGGGAPTAVVDASTDLRCTDREASWYLSGGGGGFDDLSMTRFSGMDRDDDANDAIEVKETL